MPSGARGRRQEKEKRTHLGIRHGDTESLILLPVVLLLPTTLLLILIRPTLSLPLPLLLLQPLLLRLLIHLDLQQAPIILLASTWCCSEQSKTSCGFGFGGFDGGLTCAVRVLDGGVTAGETPDASLRVVVRSPDGGVVAGIDWWCGEVERGCRGAPSGSRGRRRREGAKRNGGEE